MTKAVVAPLVDGETTIRPLERHDLPLTLAWRNHPESRAWFHSTELIAPEQHEAWFGKYCDRLDDFVFIVEISREPVAQVALYDIADGRAEFGRLLVDPGARGRGISHIATGLCLRIADEALMLDEVHLEVKRDNSRAIVAYERAGFVVDPDTSGTDGSLKMRRTRQTGVQPDDAS